MSIIASGQQEHEIVDLRTAVPIHRIRCQYLGMRLTVLALDRAFALTVRGAIH